MICLGIDTTGAACSAALVDGSRVLASRSEIIHRGHAEILGPMVEDILDETNTRPQDMAKISVCTGPGSFTGLRVGLSFAKGLALPWQTPVVGVSGLEAWAQETDPERTRSVITVADVRRGEVFWQKFDKGLAVSAPKLTDVDTAKTAVGKQDIIVGNGAALLAGDPQGSITSPSIIARLGLERTPDTHPAEPLYHRPPDAKLPGGRTLN